MTQKDLKVTISYDELTAQFEGQPADVYEQVVRFLEKVLPAYRLSSMIQRSASVTELMERLKGLIAYSEGEGIYLTKPFHTLATPDAILLLLTIRHLESALGLKEMKAVTPKEMMAMLGRPMKTVSGRLSELVRKGYVKRLGRAGYSLTGLGLSYVLDTFSAEKG
ncbi:MAG: hypothetical protein QW756_07740 [Nitrososphaerota archaeon]